MLLLSSMVFLLGRVYLAILQKLRLSTELHVFVQQNTGARSRLVVIRHNRNYVTNLDIELKATCTVKSGDVDVKKTYTTNL